MPLKKLSDKQKAHLERITALSIASRKKNKPKCKYNYVFGGKSYTRHELADYLGVTRERIRQLHNKGKLEERVMNKLSTC